MSAKKTERNLLIVKQIQSGKSYQEVAEMFGLKAKSTIADIFYRTRKELREGVRSYPQVTVARVRR